MTDIVERIHDFRWLPQSGDDDSDLVRMVRIVSLANEAADEITRLTADAREQHQRAIDAAEAIFHLREALTTVRDNIGVPQPGYPANVAHAYEVACAALGVKP